MRFTRTVLSYKSKRTNAVLWLISLSNPNNHLNKGLPGERFRAIMALLLNYSLDHFLVKSYILLSYHWNPKDMPSHLVSYQGTIVCKFVNSVIVLEETDYCIIKLW